MGIPSEILSKHSGDYAEELRVAAQLAREAGAIALQYHGEDISVDLKIGDEPVTVADHESSAHLVAGLSQAFPDDIVISEEVPDDPRRLSAKRVWYVDPIDGTKAFIRGENSYCVMIGLAVEHAPVLGIVYQPNFDVLLFASQGAGAWHLGGKGCRRLRTSEQGQPDAARHLGAGSKYPANWPLIAEELGLPAGNKISSIGLRLSTIAIGASDLYVNPYTNCSSWDTCGPQAILEEAGGTLSDMHGLPLRYDSAETLKHGRGLIASNGTVHQRIVDKLSELYPDPGPK